HLMEGVWRILASAPIETAHVYNSFTENFRAVVPSNSAFHTVVYKMSRNDLLVVTANLGSPASATLQLNGPGLGLTGTYRVSQLSGMKAPDFQVRDLGVTSDGLIHANGFAQYECRGYRLKAPHKAAASCRGLR